MFVIRGLYLAARVRHAILITPHKAAAAVWGGGRCAGLRVGDTLLRQLQSLHGNTSSAVIPILLNANSFFPKSLREAPR